MPLIELTQVSHPTEQKKYSAVIGVPVHNEERYIARSLQLLDQQADPTEDYAVVLLLNNCTDGTLDVLQSLQAHLQHDVYYSDIELPKNLAHAGMARKLAMDAAARLTAPHGIVLTTDADAVVTNDWLAMTRKHIAEGAEAVVGFVQHNPAEKTEWPEALKARTDLEHRYEDFLAELYALLDPVPHNPPPCHMVMLGASLAATREAYQKCGGVPPIPCGEDRAFIAALERIDARVRFPRDVVAYTSSRLAGRADGGMAATLKARAEAPDLPCDPLLEPVELARKRARWRHELRTLWPNALPLAWAATLKISPDRLGMAWAAPGFGQAWQALEAASPELERHPLSLAELKAELPELEALVKQLRAQAAGTANATAQRTHQHVNPRPKPHSKPHADPRRNPHEGQRLEDSNYLKRAASAVARSLTPQPAPTQQMGTPQMAAQQMSTSPLAGAGGVRTGGARATEPLSGPNLADTTPRTA